jgi:hypothetical protein
MRKFPFNYGRPWSAACDWHVISGSFITCLAFSPYYNNLLVFNHYHTMALPEGFDIRNISGKFTMVRRHPSRRSFF